MTACTQQDGLTILELGATYQSLDEDSLDDFGSLLLTEATIAEPPRMLVDLSQTQFIGSVFIELLVRAWKRLAERNGVLALCGPGPFCASVLRVMRLDSLWPIYPDRAEAVRALAGARDRERENGEGGTEKRGQSIQNE